MPDTTETPTKLPTVSEIKAACGRNGNLARMTKMADAAGVPVWVLLIPGLTKDFFANKRQHGLIRVVQEYIAGDALDNARDGIWQAKAVIELARTACVDDDLDQYNALGGVLRILDGAEAELVKAGAPS